MRALTKRSFAVVAVVGGLILAGNGTALAKDLPSKATVNGTGTFNNSGGTTRFSEADMKAWARLAAELHAESQCASGQIRQKHLLVTESSYWLGTDRKSQHSRVSIRTKCW